MRGVAIKLGLTGLMILGLVAMNLGVDWAAWVTAGSLMVLALLIVFSWLPFGNGDLGDAGSDG